MLQSALKIMLKRDLLVDARWKAKQLANCTLMKVKNFTIQIQMRAVLVCYLQRFCCFVGQLYPGIFSSSSDHLERMFQPSVNDERMLQEVFSIIH